MEENKYKATLFNDYNECAHLILTESQVNLLRYLSQINSFREGFGYSYILKDNDIEWKEI